MTGYPRRTVGVAAATLLALIAAGFIVLNDPTPTPAAVEGVCQAHLGPEWEMAGLIEHPTLDHYDVQCMRSTGLFSSETEWVTIPRGDA